MGSEIFSARFQQSVLEFKRPATTSRLTLKEHTVYYIFLTKNNITGTGEAAPLKGLSVDDVPDFELRLQAICDQINQGIAIENIDLTNLPSIQFALETALLDLQNGGRKILFDTSFTRSEKPILMNGLVWMNDSRTMLTEAFEKVELVIQQSSLKLEHWILTKNVGCWNRFAKDIMSGRWKYGWMQTELFPTRMLCKC